MSIPNYAHYYMADEEIQKLRVDELIEKDARGEHLYQFEIEIINAYCEKTGTPKPTLLKAKDATES